MRNRVLVVVLIALLSAFPVRYAAADAGKETQGIDGKIMGLFLEGEQRQQEKRYPEAIMVYRRSLKIKPNQPDLLFRIGYCYERMGESKKALDYYKQALALNPALDEARKYVESHPQ